MTTNPYDPPTETEPHSSNPPKIARMARGYLPAVGIGALGGVLYLIANGIYRFHIFDLDTYAPLNGAAIAVGIYYLFHSLTMRRSIQHLPPQSRIVAAAVTTALIVLIVGGVLFVSWLVMFVTLFTAFA
jgi:hypothetical protein